MFAEEKGRYQDYASLEAAESFDFSQLRAGDWSKIKHVRTGILLLLIDKIVHTVIALSCLALLLYFQPMFLKEVGKPGNDDATALGLLVGVGTAFICFAGCPIFLSGSLALVGTALCTDVPQVTGAKRPMIFSIVCYGLLSFAGKLAGQIQPILAYQRLDLGLIHRLTTGFQLANIRGNVIPRRQLNNNKRGDRDQPQQNNRVTQTPKEIRPHGKW